MRIELGNTPSQKRPKAENTEKEVLHSLYKDATGKNATYKRGGEWHESKAYKEWQDGYYADEFEDVKDAINGVQNGDVPEDIPNDIEESEYVDLNILSTKQIFQIIRAINGVSEDELKILVKEQKNAGRSFKEALLHLAKVLNVQFKNDKSKEYRDKHDGRSRLEHIEIYGKDVDHLISAKELNAKMDSHKNQNGKVHANLVYLYELMSNKMDFNDDVEIDDDIINKLEEIKEMVYNE